MGEADVLRKAMGKKLLNYSLNKKRNLLMVVLRIVSPRS